MRNGIGILLFILATLASPVHADYDQGVVIVKRIEVVSGQGAGSVDAGAVRARLKTRENEMFSQRDFDEDLKALAKEYFRIEPTIETQNGQTFITLKVWPKPSIRKLEWVGNERMKTSKLEGELGYKVGGLFDRQAFNTAFHKVQAYYVKKGYFEAQLDYDVIPDPNTDEVDITIRIQEGRSGRVQKIEYVGFTPDEEVALSKMVLSTEYSLFTSWIMDTGTYEPDRVEQDRLVILNFLQNEGYADARATIEAIDSPKNNRIILRVTADKGIMHHVGTVTFSGNTYFTDKEVRDVMKIKEGDPFSPEQMREVSDAIQLLYGKKGYIDALAIYRPSLRQDATIYDVHFAIEEGEQYRVGMIKVIGNNWTQRSVILHETLLVPGEVFNLQKLRLTEQRLFNIDYFETVNVYPVRTSPLEGMDGNYRDVIIEVEEKGTGNFGFSAGFSSADSIFGGLNVVEKNFNLAGIARVPRDGLVALRGGGEYLAIRTMIGGTSSSYSLAWTKPYVWDTQWIFGVELEKSYSAMRRRQFELGSKSLRTTFQYPLNQFVRFGTHYRLRDTMVHVEGTKGHKEFDEDEGETAELTPEEAENRDEGTQWRENHEDLLNERHNTGLLSAVGVSLTYDSTDHPVKPHNGFRSYLGSEFAGVGGRWMFLKWEYLNTYYKQIFKNGVVKLRGDVQFIQPLGHTSQEEVPLAERFFLGGETSIRGFRPGAIGPEFTNSDPRGGISASLLSAEYNHTFHERIDGFVFTDMGNVSLHTYSPSINELSIGLGTRLTILPNLPPFTIGYAWPINPNEKGQVKKLFFAIGGNF